MAQFRGKCRVILTCKAIFKLEEFALELNFSNHAECKRKGVELKNFRNEEHENSI